MGLNVYLYGATESHSSGGKPDVVSMQPMLRFTATWLNADDLRAIRNDLKHNFGGAVYCELRNEHSWLQSPELHVWVIKADFDAVKKLLLQGLGSDTVTDERLVGSGSGAEM